jgi:hypothetical protein
MKKTEGGAAANKRRLRRRAAAAYIKDRHGLPCAEATLRKLAMTGGGPAFRKANRVVLYDVADLDDWATGRIGPRVTSTSQLRPDAGGAAHD